MMKIEQDKYNFIFVSMCIEAVWCISYLILKIVMFIYTTFKLCPIWYQALLESL